MSEKSAAKGITAVTFTLENEMYALEIEKVREVLEPTLVTKVPQTPCYLRGVINLRGNVVPVMDLRARFGMAEVERTHDTRIIITEIEMDGASTLLGVMADSVREVIELEAGEIGPAPKLGTSVGSNYLKGIGRRNDGFILILDLDQVFSAQELAEAADLPAPLPMDNGQLSASAQ